MPNVLQARLALATSLRRRSCTRSTTVCAGSFSAAYVPTFIAPLPLRQTSENAILHSQAVVTKSGKNSNGSPQPRPVNVNGMPHLPTVQPNEATNAHPSTLPPAAGLR